jgi:hypothetical protein
MIDPQINLKGRIVSIWERSSSSHKWRMTLGFVLITRHEGDKVCWQDSKTGNHYTRQSETTALLNDQYRKADVPVFNVPIAPDQEFSAS